MPLPSTPVKTAIVLFVYRRWNHTQQVIDALQRNTFAQTMPLVVFVDGAKGNGDEADVQAVRDVVDQITGFLSVEVHVSPINRGIAKSVIAGVTSVFERFSSVIVLEDDIVTSPNFLMYMTECLGRFGPDQSIFSISGYCVPILIPDGVTESIFISRRPLSWGWACWRDRWEKIDWEFKDYSQFVSDRDAVRRFNEGGNDLTEMIVSYMRGGCDFWDIQFAYAHFKHNAWSVVPTRSKVQNIGTDGTGTHFPSHTSQFDVELDPGGSPLIFPEVPLIPNSELLNRIRCFFDVSKWERLKRWVFRKFYPKGRRR